MKLICGKCGKVIKNKSKVTCIWKLREHAFAKHPEVFGG